MLVVLAKLGTTHWWIGRNMALSQNLWQIHVPQHFINFYLYDVAGNSGLISGLWPRTSFLGILLFWPKFTCRGLKVLIFLCRSKRLQRSFKVQDWFLKHCLSKFKIFRKLKMNILESFFCFHFFLLPWLILIWIKVENGAWMFTKFFESSIVRSFIFFCSTNCFKSSHLRNSLPLVNFSQKVKQYCQFTCVRSVGEKASVAFRLKVKR